jgi:hypothetical protein
MHGVERRKDSTHRDTRELRPWKHPFEKFVMVNDVKVLRGRTSIRIA